MRQFSFYKRDGIFYACFRDPATRERLPGRSTGKDNRDEALVVVHQWLEKGLPLPVTAPLPVKQELKAKALAAHLEVSQLLTEIKVANLDHQDVKKIEAILMDKGLISMMVLHRFPEAELFTDFLTRFWTFEESPYVKERLSHKLKIGRTHTKLSLERVKRYWIPYFEGRSIGEIQREDLQKFSNWLLKENPDASGVTLKHIFDVGITALRWALANGVIRYNPIEKLTPYSQKLRKRGILKPEEVVKLFNLEWDDPRALLVNIVAMSTGMRIAEILALRVENIGEKYISVENSYSWFDGLKCTKTGEPRIVPVIPEIRDAMRKMGNLNPHDNRFIFFCNNPERPWDQEMPALALKKMLIRMKAGDRPPKNTPKDEIREWEKKRDDAAAYWKQRNVVFHSWRHFFSAELSKRLKARQVMMSTGHKTEAVFWEYARHILDGDMLELAQTQGQIFGKLLPEISIGQYGKQETGGDNVLKQSQYTQSKAGQGNQLCRFSLSGR
jgi:integrase